MKKYAEGGMADELISYQKKPMSKAEQAASSKASKNDVTPPPGMRGKPPEFKKYASGGSVSASRRADGVAQRGKTKGRFL